MKSIKNLLTILFVIALPASFTFAQNMDSVKMDYNMKDMHMNNDSAQTMKMDTTRNSKDSIVREGVIDLRAIDVNKDGKVYQDMMDYNVISDKPGTCPLCGMTLKEVSLKKAKEILLKSGFKVKE